MDLLLAFVYVALMLVKSFIPDEVISNLEDRPPFPVYWNVPTFQCHKYGLNFSRVSSVWGIRQNPGDDFRGDVISILYDPGEFPALLEAPPLESIPRNGGIPQEGSLAQHLRNFKAHIEKLIPWQNYEGLAILDFEHWRPIWHQNWGSLNIYRTYSRVVERRRHPFWFYSMIESEAEYRYELAAKMFLLETLKLAKFLRPKAKWGYYGYPFCFNYTPNNNRESCSEEVVMDNDKMEWLFSETTGYYPSLYLKQRDMGSITRRRFVRGRLTEALRVAKTSHVYPYVWYKYHDTKEFLSPADMMHVIGAPRERGCSGVVIWGASKDVNTEAKCRALEDYLENTLGPAVTMINAGFTVDPSQTSSEDNTEIPGTTTEISYTDSTTTESETTTLRFQGETATFSPLTDYEEMNEETEEVNEEVEEEAWEGHEEQEEPNEETTENTEEQINGNENFYGDDLEEFRNFNLSSSPNLTNQRTTSEYTVENVT